MRFRTGLIAGLAVGYYLGRRTVRRSRPGSRERTDRLQRLVATVREGRAASAGAEKLRAAVDLGAERVRDARDRSDHRPTSPSVPTAATANGHGRAH